MAKKWFEENEIEVLEWPPQSPDLNPIEHLWVELKRRLNSYEEEPKSMYELWERVQDTWNDIGAATCKKLVESMPSRITAVLEAKSGYKGIEMVLVINPHQSEKANRYKN